jgi:signal transduction histidine kinase
LLALGRREQTAPLSGDLAALLDDVEAMVRPSCRHSRVEFKTNIDLEAESSPVSDAEAIRVTLLNLVLNAIDAAGPGGTVRIDAGRRNGSLRVDVSDTGDGPPEALQSTLFEPFVTSKPEGIGLGLALARQAALDQGGTLTWKRENGDTVFSLTLPAFVGIRSSEFGISRSDEGGSERECQELSAQSSSIGS